MISNDRWKTAQTYEQGFWKAQAEQIASGTSSKLDWYRWRSDRLVERLEGLGLQRLTNGGARVVEVGSGPVGVVTFFPGVQRAAYDPLADFYATNAALTELRDPTVEYTAAKGEQIPRPDASADLVIIENCIDHVQDMHVVLRELHRVLDRDGILYLTVNNRCRPGYYVHRALSRLRIDKGHPHTLTPDRTRRLMEHNGFNVMDLHTESYWSALLEDLKGPSIKARLKAVMGVSEYVVSLIARRR